MCPDPEPGTFDPETIDHFFDNWCSLAWTEWIPFNATKQVWTRIPREPGLYRIRPVGKEYLVYIGETKRTLRDRLHTLRLELEKSEQMPWSDPHAEAPALWAYRKEWLADNEAEERPAPESEPEAPQEPAGDPSAPAEPLLPSDPHGYECSAAPLDASDSGRRGMESYLLYRYRQENGESPLCNFGRFPARYRRSSTKNEGKRGGKLADGQKDNPAGGPGQPPLTPSGTPGERDWMGLPWSAPAPLDAEQLKGVPEGQGFYLLLDGKEVILIGRAGNLSSQLAGQAERGWEGMAIAFSFHAIGEPLLPHQLRELENDLVGNFYEQYRKPPVFQFRVSSH
jgi:hypothetical protein